MNIRQLTVAGLVTGLTACASAPPAATPDADLEWRAADSVAAMAAFRSNIASIHQRDRAAYLAHYLQSPRLARTGAAGVDWGYAGLAAGDPNSWPDTLVATHFEVVPLAPGVAYGSYRYRVVDGGSQRGVSERVLVRQPNGEWKIAVSTAFGSPGNIPVPAFALTGATIIDATGAAPRTGTVVMRDGMIACVGECDIPEDVEVIDATGKWIIPGIVDAHVHYSQTGWADGRPDALDLRDRFPYDATIAELEANPERFYRSYLCAGVTATFDVGGYPWTWDLRGAAERSTAAPHVAAAGPLITPFAPDQLLLPGTQQFILMASDSATREAARMVGAFGSDALKVWYVVGARSDTTLWKRRVRIAAAEAEAAGIPLIVHATNLWAAKDALRAGAKLLVHSVEDRPVDDEFIQLTLDNGAIYTPTLTVREGYVELRERNFQPDFDMACIDPETRRKAFLTDSIPGPTLSDDYREAIARGYEVMVANLQRVNAAGIPIAMGTDAGNPLTLHGPSVYPEMEAMAAAGLTPMEVIIASTRTSARAMGRTDFGTIETGNIADLVVLDGNPLADISNVSEVALVVRAGEIWTREELEYR
ncbi:MAG TPA: amidohydrolase family protein [Longimicrobiaceae bacterium]|nr:amidohydrolase family protein [Longimicrobiaceae bacterium]